VSGVRPTPVSGVVAFPIGRPIDRADIRELCNRVRALLEGSDADMVVCDVRALVDPDVAAVDALARLQLAARRMGGRVQLLHAPSELQDLLALTGLRDVVPLLVGLPAEARGQAEQGEHALGIEEERDPADPVA
jgi:ABC-type transporter Mla MlaB component